MNYQKICILTEGESFYNITDSVNNIFHQHWRNSSSPTSGILYLFTPHTSCALTISEAFDPSAAHDMENFMKQVAPTDLPFIQHTSEGVDDSPSHMKSILLNTGLHLIVDQNELILGTWQGIYLCEFRNSHKKREVYLKFQSD